MCHYKLAAPLPSDERLAILLRGYFEVRLGLKVTVTNPKGSGEKVAPKESPEEALTVLSELLFLRWCLSLGLVHQTLSQ